MIIPLKKVLTFRITLFVNIVFCSLFKHWESHKFTIRLYFVIKYLKLAKFYLKIDLSFKLIFIEIFKR